MSRRSFVIFSMFCVLALGTLLALGTWQVHRLTWKQTLINQIETQRRLPPKDVMTLFGVAPDRTDISYLPVYATGQFDHDNERHFYAIGATGPGWHIYTPLKLSGGKILFVNRGIVPLALKAAAQRLDGQISGDQRVTGVVRKPEQQGRFVPDNNIANNEWYWRDIDGLTNSVHGIAASDVLPFTVDLDDNPVPGGFPRGGVTRFKLSNRHLGYVITWYGLALALTGVYAFFLFGQLRRWRAQDQA